MISGELKLLISLNIMSDIWKRFLYKKTQTRGISFSMAPSLKKNTKKIKKIASN